MSHTTLLACPLSASERLLVDELKHKAGLSTDTDIVRLALWHVARHLDVVPRAVDFKVGDRRRLTARTDVRR